MTKDLNQKIIVIGFKNTQIENVNTFLNDFRRETNNAPIQFFDAKNIAGSQHLYFSALNALNAFRQRRNISNNLAVEALLYASAQRQIKKAVEMLGVKQGSSEVAALIIAEDDLEEVSYLQLLHDTIRGEQDNSVLDLTNEKFENIKKLFQISDVELDAKLEKQGAEKEALTDLVIERMALLGTRS